MAIFEAVEVTKQYANHLAIEKVSISVPEQSIYGLLGPNGAGKTTLIRIINQITAPDSGKLFLNGKPLRPADITQIGYLPEERGLYKKMKVGEQVLYFARLKGISKPEAMRRIKYWFKKLEIIDWWDKKVEELSKGMQQKAQFVATILHEPKLLIFDEPFSGFDPVNANMIKNEILFLRERGATVLFSTHNMSSVEELCDDITLIHRARVLLEGKVDKIRNDWSANEFEVTFAGEVAVNVNDHFRLIEKRNENGKTHLRVATPTSIKSNDVLQFLMGSGNILAFNPALPTMNEIFIKVVESRNETVDA